MGDASNKATRQVSKPSRWQGIKAEFKKISWPKRKPYETICGSYYYNSFTKYNNCFD